MSSPLNRAVSKTLPIELTVDILSKLDCISLLTCTQVGCRFNRFLICQLSNRQVCRLFNTLINNTATLRLIFELYATGQQDGFVDPKVNPTDRLDALKRHTIAWEELTWVTEQHLPMLDGGLWELYGGVLAQSNLEGDITFRQLPSEIRSIAERDWTIGGFDFIVRDFAMDPLQNLLVLVEDPKWYVYLTRFAASYFLRIVLGLDHLLTINVASTYAACPQVLPTLWPSNQPYATPRKNQIPSCHIQYRYLQNILAFSSQSKTDETS